MTSSTSAVTNRRYFQATVLSKIAGQEVARTFLTRLVDGHRFPTIFITEALYAQALHLFQGQEKKAPV